MPQPPAGVEVKVEPVGAEGTRIPIAGGLDERVKLGETAARAVAPVVVDLADVRFIDSVGVREWVDFLRALPRPVRLRRCSEAMVYQFGMVRETLQDAVVESFIAPLECEKCGREERVDVAVPPGLTSWRSLDLGRHACPACGGRLVLGQHPERYLFFLGDE